MGRFTQYKIIEEKEWLTEKELVWKLAPIEEPTPEERASDDYKFMFALIQSNEDYTAFQFVERCYIERDKNGHFPTYKEVIEIFREMFEYKKRDLTPTFVSTGFRAEPVEKKY